jgi:hypothetical protein
MHLHRKVKKPPPLVYESLRLIILLVSPHVSAVERGEYLSHGKRKFWKEEKCLTVNVEFGRNPRSREIPDGVF